MSRHSDRPIDIDRLFADYRRTQDVAVRNRIVEAETPLADRCARRFAHRGEPYADVQQVARLGLVKAVERFQPARGVSFPSFATPTIVGEIKRYFRDRTWAVSVPRTAKDHRAVVSSAVDRLQQDLGRSPTAVEIAGYADVPVAAVTAALHANGVYRTASLDALEGPDRQLAGAMETERAMEIAAREALARLDERTRTIMYLRFYEDRTQREIGERIGVGQVQVSRLIRAAIDELRVALAATPA